MKSINPFNQWFRQFLLTQEYIITDDQGNARVSFQNNGSGVAVVKQENSYYGFGLALANSPVGMSSSSRASVQRRPIKVGHSCAGEKFVM